MSYIDRATFHYFHFFPYTGLPANAADKESLWVDYSNANYDPNARTTRGEFAGKAPVAPNPGAPGEICQTPPTTAASVSSSACSTRRM